MNSSITPAARLKAAADAVIDQAMEYPDLGIPADPDVADFMGCFEETAVSPDDFIQVEDEDETDHA
jgi:hypothetical protein